MDKETLNEIHELIGEYIGLIYGYSYIDDNGVEHIVGAQCERIKIFDESIGMVREDNDWEIREDTMDRFRDFVDKTFADRLKNQKNKQS